MNRSPIRENPLTVDQQRLPLSLDTTVEERHRQLARDFRMEFFARSASSSDHAPASIGSSVAVTRFKNSSHVSSSRFNRSNPASSIHRSGSMFGPYEFTLNSGTVSVSAPSTNSLVCRTRMAPLGYGQQGKSTRRQPPEWQAPRPELHCRHYEGTQPTRLEVTPASSAGGGQKPR